MVMEDDGVTNFKLGSSFVHHVWTCCTRFTISNMAYILTEVMHLHITGGFTCHWIVSNNKSCIVKYLR